MQRRIVKRFVPSEFGAEGFVYDVYERRINWRNRWVWRPIATTASRATAEELYKDGAVQIIKSDGVP